MYTDFDHFSLLEVKQEIYDA